MAADPVPPSEHPFADRFVRFQEALAVYKHETVNIAVVRGSAAMEDARERHHDATVEVLRLYNEALTKWQLLEKQLGPTQGTNHEDS